MFLKNFGSLCFIDNMKCYYKKKRKEKDYKWGSSVRGTHGPGISQEDRTHSGIRVCLSIG